MKHSSPQQRPRARQFTLKILQAPRSIHLLRIAAPHLRQRSYLDQRCERICCGELNIRIEHAYKLLTSVTQSIVVVCTETKGRQVVLHIKYKWPPRQGRLRLRLGNIQGKNHPGDNSRTVFANGG